jgi:hypothetical protein
MHVVIALWVVGSVWSYCATAKAMGFYKETPSFRILARLSFFILCATLPFIILPMHVYARTHKINIFDKRCW